MSNDRKFGFNEHGVLEWVAPNPDVRAGQVGTVTQQAYAIRWDNGGESSSGADYLAGVEPSDWSDSGLGATFGIASVEKRGSPFTTGSVVQTIGAVEVHPSSVTNTPTDAPRVSIYSDSSGEPGSVLATATSSVADWATGATNNYLRLAFASPVTLEPSTQYWIIFERTGSTDESNYYGETAKSDYNANTAIYSSGSWTTGNDHRMIFRLITSLDLSPDVGYRARFLFRETGGKNASANLGKLQYQVSKDGGTNWSGWGDIGTGVTPPGYSTGVYVYGYTGAQVADGTSTTQQLGSGTFTTGTVEAGTATSANVAIAAGGETEIEWTFYINDGFAVDGDLIQLRAVYSDSTALDAYAAGSIPEITVTDYAWDQTGFRFREDIESESGTTWLEPLNTNPDLDLDTTYRVRFLVELTDGYRNSGPYLTLQQNYASGGWEDVTTSTEVVPYTSSYLTNDTDSTQQLGTGPFIADNNLIGSNDVTLGLDPNEGTTTSESAPSYETEVEFTFRLSSTNGATATDTVQLRVVEDRKPDNGATYTETGAPFVLGAYTQTPTITVASGAVIEYGAASITGSGTVAADPTAIFSAALDVSGTATVAASARRDLGGVASISGTATVNASATVLTLELGAASIAGTATVAPVPSVLFASTANIFGTATSGGISSIELVSTASVSGTATVNAVPTRILSFTASIDATATVSATGALSGVQAGAASITGTATVNAIPQLAFVASATISGTATVNAVSSADVPAAASVNATATMTSNGQPVVFARPVSDITLGNWKDEGDGVTNIYQSIDEVTPSDADYIYGSNTYETQLTSYSDPTSSVYHSVIYRYYKTGDTSATVNLNVKLMDGTTEIASWNHLDISVSVTESQQYLTQGQADAIVNYNDLRLRFTVSTS